MTTTNNTKGESHTSCKEKGDCTAYGYCYGFPLSGAAQTAKTRLIEAGIPEGVADMCAWLSEPMFRHEYPDVDPDSIITDPETEEFLRFMLDLGWDYDIWIGVGYESAHSDSACKMHFEVDAKSGELTWCNVSEWAQDDDRWRGTAVFYDPRADKLSFHELYDRIERSFAS